MPPSGHIVLCPDRLFQRCFSPEIRTAYPLTTRALQTGGRLLREDPVLLFSGTSPDRDEMLAWQVLVRCAGAYSTELLLVSVLAFQTQNDPCRKVRGRVVIPRSIYFPR